VNEATRTLLSPLFTAQYRHTRSRAGIRPHDVPFAAGPGSEPDRVLIVGTGPAVGWGVSTHSVALPGQLARRLRVATGRGSHVAAFSDPDERLTTLPQLIAEHVLYNWDVIVVTLGAAEPMTLRSPASFADELRKTVSAVIARSHPVTRVVVTSAPLQDALRDVGPGRTRLVTSHARVLEDVAREVCADIPGATHLTLPDQDRFDPQASDQRETSVARHFALWAEVIAQHVAPLLEEQRARPDSPQEARNRPQPLATRLAAIYDLDVVRQAPDDALRRITDRARELFGTDFAAFNLVLEGHQTTHVSTKESDIGVSTPIAESFCSMTIRADEPFVIPDSRSSDEDVPQTAVRFYAGYPVHSIDGTRIGAICVFDHEPRRAAGLPIEALRDFALEVERELYRRVF
jgi:hypothetical protein